MFKIQGSPLVWIPVTDLSNAAIKQTNEEGTNKKIILTIYLIYFDLLLI
jgi:hypothetical protein